ncbi:MAG TPA: hypothetical protein VII99_10475, partial [Bacteroidia bacterium]
MKTIYTLPLALLIVAMSAGNAFATITDALKIHIARGSYSDETVIRFVDGATNGFDASFDSWKLFSYNAAVPNIFTKDSAADELSINAFPEFKTSITKDVFLSIGTAGTYSFSAAEMGAFAPGMCIKMKDLQSGKLYEMRTSNTYTIALPVIHETDPARFRVFFSYPASFTYQSGGSGKWSSLSTWIVPECGCAVASTVPAVVNNVIVSAGNAVTLDSNSNCSNLTISGSLAGNANLNISGNWINNGTYVSGSKTVTFSGSQLQIISGTSVTSFNNLAINNSTPIEAVRLSTPVTVNGNLALQDGHITTTATNILTCGTASSISLLATPQDSSFVKGPMNQIVNVDYGVTKIFPVGKDNSYRRIDLTVDQKTAAATTYTAEMFNNSAMAFEYAMPVGISNVSAERYHVISQNPVTTQFDMAQVRMYFGCDGGNDNVVSLQGISVVKDNGTGNWIDLGDTPFGFNCGGVSYWGNSLSGTFTSFTGNKFALANVGNPSLLPVTLEGFQAVPENENVTASWNTFSEQNSASFIVERSKTGTGFEEVGSVPAAGNSTTEI